MQMQHLGPQLLFRIMEMSSFRGPDTHVYTQVPDSVLQNHNYYLKCGLKSLVVHVLDPVVVKVVAECYRELRVDVFGNAAHLLGYFLLCIRVVRRTFLASPISQHYEIQGTLITGISNRLCHRDNKKEHTRRESRGGTHDGRTSLRVLSSVSGPRDH